MGSLNDHVLTDLLDRARAPGLPASCGSAEVIAQHGVSPEDLADRYIPEVARRLGHMWLEDKATFAEVTVGTSRLQSLLRDVSRGWHADMHDRRSYSAVLMIVPQGEQHVLGSLVLASWLRRHGVSVTHCIGPTSAELSRLLEMRQFDGAMVSVSCADGVDGCIRLIRTLRGLARRPIHIAVGGPAADTASRLDLQGVADIVTSDVTEYMRCMKFDVSGLGVRASGTG